MTDFDADTLERYREEVRQGLLNVALKFGQGVSRKGKPYKWMVDCRELLLTGPYLHYATRLLWERLKPYRPDAVGGLTLAANPMTIGVMVESRQDGQALDGVLIRRQPKENGLRKQVEGPELKPGCRLALVDDLVNSGDSQRQAMAAVRPFDCVIPVVGVIIDYQNTGSVWLKERGIAVEALFTLAELGISPRPVRDNELLKPVWSFPDLNSGDYSAPKSAPRVAGESLYVGSDRGFLACLDLEGRERWRYAVRDEKRGIHGTPLVHDSRVYFGAYDGYLYCVGADTGQLAWETRPGQWIGSSPAVHPGLGLLYVGIEYGETGGSLIAVEAETGRQRWEVAARHYIHSSPWVDQDRSLVLVGSNDGILRAADAEHGTLLWEFATGGPIKAQPVVDSEGRCFFGSFDGFLYALRAESGELLWKRKLSEHLYNTPLIVEDLVIAGGHSERLIALGRDGGEVRWVAATGSALVGGASYCPALKAAAVASTGGRLCLFSVQSGDPLWTRKLEDKAMGQPTVVGERLYHFRKPLRLAVAIVGADVFLPGVGPPVAVLAALLSS